MQALRNATAAFCLACICAEVLAQLTVDGWPRRCIKAAAGLYILVVLFHALPAVKSEVAAFSLPQGGAASFGSAQENILLAAQSQLAQTLAAQCKEQTGVEVRLMVTLAQNGESVCAAAVEAALPEGCTARQREQVASFLREALGTEPVLTAGEGER